MATGDRADIVARLKLLLPPWFPLPAPIVDGVMTGIAAVLSWSYSFIQYVRLQTRIATATDGWLDLIAWDYFGVRFLRRLRETDASFRTRILPEILRPRQTRAGITKMLLDLTGWAPVIVEPWNTGDCGAYNIGTLAYGVAGCYGSLLLPNQVLITAYRPAGAGIPNIAGYGAASGGYGVGVFAYVSITQVIGPVTDAEIYQRTYEVMASGCTGWEQITSANVPSQGAGLMFDQPGNSEYMPLF